MASSNGANGSDTLQKLLLLELRERRSVRRGRFLRRLLVLLIVLAVAGLWLRERLPTPTVAVPHTAVVRVEGEIASDSDASAERLLPALRNALKDSNTRALVLLINSPGGSPVQSGIVNDEIRRLRKEHGKPIYAVVEESCASGAYYIAAAADDIYVDKASIVGSIGVLMNGFGFVDAMDKLGIERRLLTAGENKGFLDPFSPLPPEQRAYAQTMLEQIHQQFIQVVRDGRGDRLQESPDLFSGLFWSGEQAVQMGLADGLGSLHSVARDVVKAEKVVDYTNRPNVAERFARRFGAAMGRGAVQALQAAGQLPELR